MVNVLTPPADSVKSADQATVYLPTPIHPSAEAYAKERFGRVIKPIQGVLTAEECLRLADGIVSRTGDLRAGQLAQAKRLKMITRNGTGCDNIDLDYCSENEIIVLNNPGANAMAVAEMMLTLALNVVRRVKEIDVRITSGEVVPSIKALSGTLINATVGIIGMGDTAYHLSLLLQPFSPRILVHSPTSPKERWTVPDEKYPQTITHERKELSGLLGEVDVLMVCCPLTSSTKGMISTEELRRMKKTAVVVNCARGGIVDESALACALKDGWIAGAGLDVWEIEPPTKESMGELGQMTNVICTSHMAGSTDQVQYETCKAAVDMLADYFDGKGLKNRVV